MTFSVNDTFYKKVVTFEFKIRVPCSRVEEVISLFVSVLTAQVSPFQTCVSGTVVQITRPAERYKVCSMPGSLPGHRARGRTGVPLVTSVTGPQAQIFKWSVTSSTGPTPLLFAKS